MANFKRYLREAINNVCLPCLREQSGDDNPCVAGQGPGGMIGCWMRCEPQEGGGMNCVPCEQGDEGCRFYQTVDDWLKPRHPKHDPYYDVPLPKYGGPSGVPWIEGPGNNG